MSILFVYIAFHRPCRRNFSSKMSYAYYLTIFNYLSQEYAASGVLSQACLLQGHHGEFSCAFSVSCSLF